MTHETISKHKIDVDFTSVDNPSIFTTIRLFFDTESAYRSMSNAIIVIHDFSLRHQITPDSLN